MTASPAEKSLQDPGCPAGGSRKASAFGIG